MPKRLIIDTNLLLLVVIGAVEEGRHIHNSKRLGAYTLDDYDNILKIMRDFDEIIITPYIATEVSNLIDLSGHAKILAFEIARQLFSLFKKINVDIKSDLFLQFGITDNSLIKLACDYYILTNDYLMLEPLFNHIIPYYSQR